MIIEYLQLPAEWLKKEIERVSIIHSENKVSKIYNVWLNTLIFTALNFPNIVIMLPLLIFATYGFRCIICFFEKGIRRSYLTIVYYTSTTFALLLAELNYITYEEMSFTFAILISPITSGKPKLIHYLIG